MSAYTPGPWEADFGDFESGDSVNITASGAIIASVLGADSFPCLDDERLPGFEIELKANARLIAAVPDLLEACKRLLDAPHYEHFVVRLNDEEMAGLDAIQAAIAKAEGKS